MATSSISVYLCCAGSLSQVTSSPCRHARPFINGSSVLLRQTKLFQQRNSAAAQRRSSSNRCSVVTRASFNASVSNPFHDELIATAKYISNRGKGILASDESNATTGKRLATVGERLNSCQPCIPLESDLHEFCAGDARLQTLQDACSQAWTTPRRTAGTGERCSTQRTVWAITSPAASCLRRRCTRARPTVFLLSRS